MAWLGGDLDVGRGNDDVDDWDEFDETPYGGGFDLALTYGRPLDHSDEICYPLSTSASSDGGDYDRPDYSSGAIHNAYEPTETDSDFDDRYGSRPPPPYGFRPQEEEETEAYGGGAGYGGGVRPTPEADPYGSGYGNRPDPSEYGSGYEKPPQSEYGYGYGYDEEKPKPKPSYGYGESEEGYGGYGVQPSYGEGEEYGKPKPSYYGQSAEGYNRPKYGDDDSDEETKQRRRRHDYDDE